MLHNVKKQDRAACITFDDLSEGDLFEGYDDGYLYLKLPQNDDADAYDLSNMCNDNMYSDTKVKRISEINITYSTEN